MSLFKLVNNESRNNLGEEREEGVEFSVFSPVMRLFGQLHSLGVTFPSRVTNREVSLVETSYTLP